MTIITGGYGSFGSVAEIILDGLLMPQPINGADTIIILPMGKIGIKIDNATYLMA